MTISTNQLQGIIGNDLKNTDGEKIGKINEIYLDRQTNEPEWIATNTGLFGTNVSFVPIANATVDGEDVIVSFSKDLVKGAPNMDADGSLSKEQEAELYDYYDMDYSDEDSGSGLPDTEQSSDFSAQGHDTSGPTTDNAMTRSEEEMRVGTEQRATGRARLHKFVVTEQQTVTVPVTHEEVRMVTEPITDANREAATSGPDISEEEHEVILHEEVPVVTMQTVAKERVQLGTETVTEEQQVSADVRKERIELEDDVDNSK